VKDEIEREIREIEERERDRETEEIGSEIEERERSRD